MNTKLLWTIFLVITIGLTYWTVAVLEGIGENIKN